MKRNKNGKIDTTNLVTKHSRQLANLGEIVENNSQVKIINGLINEKQKMSQLAKSTGLSVQELKRQLKRMIENQIVGKVLIDVAIPSKFFYFLTADGISISPPFINTKVFADANEPLLISIHAKIKAAKAKKP